jgi:hypothetical protein
MDNRTRGENLPWNTRLNHHFIVLNLESEPFRKETMDITAIQRSRNHLSNVQLGNHRVFHADLVNRTTHSPRIVLRKTRNEPLREEHRGNPVGFHLDVLDPASVEVHTFNQVVHPRRQ